MLTIFIDADACPVKEEIYRVARRYSMTVVVVANAVLAVPAGAQIDLVVVSGRDFNAADDRIAEAVGLGDIVITADIPVAARCLEKGALVLDPKGRAFSARQISLQVGMRDLLDGLRKMGTVTGGPAAMTARDRSRFLAKLDDAVNQVLRASRHGGKPPSS